MILAVNWVNAGLIALISFAMVFLVLVLLIGVIKIFGIAFNEKKPQAQSDIAMPAVAADGITDEEVAAAGVEALADFIKEMGLPTSFTEMSIDPDTDYKAIADSCNLTAGCCKKLTREELLEIFLECK